MNIVRIQVENADELLNASAYGAGAVVQVQSSTTETGVFADETPTVPLVSGTREYTFYDTDGTSTTWYRTRYENAAGTSFSDWSTPFRTGRGGICDLLDAKQRLGIAATDTSEDENLAEYIDQVTTFILGFTGREFLPITETRVYDMADWSPTLWIPGGIRAYTALGYATIDQPDTGGTYTAITSGAYLRPLKHERDWGWPATRIELSQTGAATIRAFPPGKATVQVTLGDFGWAASPADAAGIGLTLVTAYHRERGSSGGDSFTLNIDGSRTFERMLSKRDRDILTWYRHVAVA